MQGQQLTLWVLCEILEARAHLPRLPIEEERAIRAEFIRRFDEE